MIHHNIDQNTDDWMALRSGIPTASQFGTVCAKGEGKTRRKYMFTLLGERLTGQPTEGYTNSHTDRGHEWEPEAADLYALLTDADPLPGGFFTIDDGSAGASPDRLIGDDGTLQIKTALPHIQLEALRANRMPPEHAKQVHGELWVSEREWCDFVSYSRGLKPLIVRVHRDEDLIRTIAAEVARFNEELAEMMEWYKGL